MRDAPPVVTIVRPAQQLTGVNHLSSVQQRARPATGSLRDDLPIYEDLVTNKFSNHE